MIIFRFISESLAGSTSLDLYPTSSHSGRNPAFCLLELS